MKIITNYVDLCRKIDMIETQLLQVDNDLDYWFGNGKLPFSRTGTDDLGVDASKGIIHDLHDKKHRFQKMLSFYLEIKEETEDKINKLEGLNYQIARMKYMENKTYKQIADELNMSYGYIRSATSKRN
ncbi:hypothetical protein MHH81_08050 [Psychrobacillus sp. FSL H8-0484]|uniref:hypothetical protein n=1 Tax=Psychrobacillus sp. FSL H8-0484 TaxID=2921390 RepID=UPI0030FA78D1